MEIVDILITGPGLRKDATQLNSWGASAPPDPPISRPGGLKNRRFVLDFKYLETRMFFSDANLNLNTVYATKCELICICYKI